MEPRTLKCTDCRIGAKCTYRPKDGNECVLVTDAQTGHDIGYATYFHPDEIGNYIEELEHVTNSYIGKIDGFALWTLTCIRALFEDTVLRGLTNIPADGLDRGPNYSKVDPLVFDVHVDEG